MRKYRGLIKYRKSMGNRINRMKNSIRALFVRRGIVIDRGEKAWFTGRKLIDGYRKPLDQCSMNELWQGELDECCSSNRNVWTE